MSEIRPFIKELDFEEALTEQLKNFGWDEVVIKNPTEEQLIRNWASIIYDNNRNVDKLGRFPLTKSEMQQIIDQVNLHDSPYAMNMFINGGQVSIRRDNPDDTNNLGKEVYLKIFDAREICAGQSRYQIVRQPQFNTGNAMLGDRRGDVTLLINGMPVIHIELKRSKVDVSQACFQLKRYAHEGVFSKGLFSMVQIFVAMTPEETLYFANPGTAERFSPQSYFHWEDFNNTIIRDWKRIVSDLLSTLMAHQLIGCYTIADDKDKTLKVLRSYQYFAVNKISDVTHKTNWDNHQHRGGYIWHTTGSGKTMTSFKSAQLIANSGDADKVVFLLDRIELSIQSLDEYRGFAGETDSIQDTADTRILLSKLESTDADDRLIVTSIQKMYNIREEANIAKELIEKIGKKRLVFIIDECHRSMFGKMLVSIKDSFPRALLFGFTGTPVFEENAKDEITTETIFGDMLHKYTIASAIPDGNVLGFDPYMVNTYDEKELRELVAFHQIDQKLKERNPETEIQGRSPEEYYKLIEKDRELKEIYDCFVFKRGMPSTYTENGNSVHGIEYYLPAGIYRSDEHHLAVADDIVKSREQLSRNGKFHAILATKSIHEAMVYYKLFKEHYPSINMVAVFDNNIDNSDEGIAREDALLEMLNDYNAKYGMTFQLATYAKYKKDVAKRLAHKKPYIDIENDHSQQIDLLIVVTQMLAGYDSKWVNTLYVDKVMKYVDVIQAFSRTNRLFGPEKPFGIIKYYSYPYTMEQNIKDALEVYVDRPLGVFVDKLEANLTIINQRFQSIRTIFQAHEIMNFEKLPGTREDNNMFAKYFSEMTHRIEAAKLQGFVWEKSVYEFQHGDTYSYVEMELDEKTYQILWQRYKELFTKVPGDPKEPWEYAIDTYITETGTGTIDAEYIDSKFRKFIKNLYTEGTGSELTTRAKEELCKTFASLSQEDQRTAMIILHDLQSGDLRLSPGKTIYDYIAEYQAKELHKQIMILSEATGLNASQLSNIMSGDVNEQNLNNFNRFEKLIGSLNLQKTREFLEKVTGKTFPPFLIIPKADSILRQFILDPITRGNILNAWLHEGVTLENADQYQESEPSEIPQVERQDDETLDRAKIKASIADILKDSLSGISKYMRSLEEILDSVFSVLDRESLETLDSVGLFIYRAFTNLFVKKASIVDKFVSFNLLVTKFEAYLKKLYYLMKNEEVQPQYEGKDVTWKDVIYAIRPLWNLKFSENEEYQKLYQYLLLIKGWRNDESHISPTASEQEVDAAINIILTMYFYTTGACITELECADSTPQVNSIYDFSDKGTLMAAERTRVDDLEETIRLDILKSCVTRLLNYSYDKKNAVFTKLRHWESIYRIAADYGFVIDNDYKYFKQVIDKMNISNLPYPLTSTFLENNNKGVYAKDIRDWSSEGLEGKQLLEYNDIKKCADVFQTIVEGTVKEYKKNH